MPQFVHITFNNSYFIMVRVSKMDAESMYNISALAYVF